MKLGSELGSPLGARLPSMTRVPRGSRACRAFLHFDHANPLPMPQHLLAAYASTACTHSEAKGRRGKPRSAYHAFCLTLAQLCLPSLLLLTLPHLQLPGSLDLRSQRLQRAGLLGRHSSHSGHGSRQVARLVHSPCRHCCSACCGGRANGRLGGCCGSWRRGLGRHCGLHLRQGATGLRIGCARSNIWGDLLLLSCLCWHAAG